VEPHILAEGGRGIQNGDLSIQSLGYNVTA
jgi:hypothetical protein